MKSINVKMIKASLVAVGMAATSVGFLNCSTGKFDVASGTTAGVPYNSDESEESTFETNEQVAANSQAIPAGNSLPGGSSPAAAAAAAINSAATTSSYETAESTTGDNLKVSIQFYSIVNGQQTNDMYIDQVIYGVVGNSSKESTYGCATLVERLAAGGCADESQWVKLPNQEWSFDDARQAWVMAKNVSSFMPADKQGIMFLHDRKNNRRATASLLLKSRPAKICRYGAVVIGPCPMPPEITSANRFCSEQTIGHQLPNVGVDSCKATYTCGCN